ncbi:hypothetical protein NFJ22_07170 [Citrobacter braakii]|uniref:hypothetical protein n=1 Tax=Citrobacter braakii TaxID=57706 RepID=UPI00243211E6|nr:hypothetical protein [Citrobacter braakii]WFV19516.1 hypothetical protein NFJ22_07170 [Citrobacter braakii]
MTNKPELTGGRTIGSRIATLLAADSVPFSDAWKMLIDAADAGQAELKELRRSYLALRGEIEDVQAQLYEAENRNEADAAELQERRKVDGAEPVFFIEVEGDDWIQAGRIPGSTFDFNNLPDGVNKLWASPQPAVVVPDEKPMPEASKMHAIDAVAAIAEVRGWNACRAAMLQAGNSPVTQDGWQLVPKEPTAAMNKAGWDAMNEHDAINPTYRAMLAAAPQQEVKSALEHGMRRYAGAMQKLSEGDD